MDNIQIGLVKLAKRLTKIVHREMGDTSHHVVVEYSAGNSVRGYYWAFIRPNDWYGDISTSAFAPTVNKLIVGVKEKARILKEQDREEI